MKKELTKRILTSLVLTAIVLNCLFINNHAWLILLVVVSLISWSEFFNLVKKIYKIFFFKIDFINHKLSCFDYVYLLSIPDKKL